MMYLLIQFFFQHFIHLHLLSFCVIDLVVSRQGSWWRQWGRCRLAWTFTNFSFRLKNNKTFSFLFIESQINKSNGDDGWKLIEKKLWFQQRCVNACLRTFGWSSLNAQLERHAYTHTHLLHVAHFFSRDLC